MATSPYGSEYLKDNVFQDQLQQQLSRTPSPGVSTKMPVDPTRYFQDPVKAGAASPVKATPSVSAPPMPSAPSPTATPAATNGSGQIFQGFTPKYAMEGFDTQREQNTGKSAKDAFAYLANQAPPPPLNDKAALGAWFTQYIQPGMDALGHKVSSVNGDAFTYGNHEGNFTVDYGRGAGAEGGALAWQAEGADDATRQRYGSPQAAQTSQPDAALPIGGQDTLVSQILAALQAQQQQSVDPQELLQQQLR